MRSRKNLLTTLLGKINGARDTTVLICGASGSGKSWVLEQLSQRLDGLPHSYLRTSPGEADWPLSGLWMILSSLTLSSPIDLEPFLPAEANKEVDTYAVARHLQQVLPERLAPGTVVLLDDLDLMDAASLKVISFLATKMQRVRACLVGTISQNPAPAELSAMSQLHLPELSRAESLELARQSAGPSADTSVLELVTAQSHGMPGEILAQLRMLSKRELTGQRPLSLPLHPTDAYGATLPLKLAGLSPNQLDLLQLVAVGPLCERSALLGAGIKDDTIHELIYRGLLEPVDHCVEIPDPALRSAIYWSLATAERRQLHQRVAEGSTHRSLQLFHRSFVHSTQVTAIELIAQAKKLVAQEYIAPAVELIERALQLDTTSDRICQQLSELASDLYHSAALFAATRYLNFAQSHLPDVLTELQITILRVRIAATLGEPTPEVDIENLIGSAQRKFPVVCGQLLAAQGCAYALREDLGAADRAIAAATALLEGALESDRVMLTQATILRAALELDHAFLLTSHQRFLGTAEDRSGLEIRQVLATALLNVGYHHEAREILARLTALGGEMTPLAQRTILLLSAANAIQNENFPRAMSLVERWIATDSPPLLKPTPQLIQAWYWMNKNRQDMADEYFESMQPHMMGEMSPKILARVAMLNGDNALVAGQPQRAVEAYRESLRFYQNDADVRYVLMSTHLIEALILLGRSEQAMTEYRERQPLMSQVPGRRAKLTLRLAQALVMEGEASVSRFQSLLAQWTPSDSTFELARVRHALGNRLQDLDQLEAAREHLVAARTLYRSLGAKAWVINVENSLAARGSRIGIDAPPEFSREEFEVVRMVQEGLTNKAISKLLFISVSAVEARLTKLYRRTGAKNRQQLAARFSAEQTGASV